MNIKTSIRIILFKVVSVSVTRIGINDIISHKKEKIVGQLHHPDTSDFMENIKKKQYNEKVHLFYDEHLLIWVLKFILFLFFNKKRNLLHISWISTINNIEEMIPADSHDCVRLINLLKFDPL